MHAILGQRVCSKCGEASPADADFCTGCGNVVRPVPVYGATVSATRITGVEIPFMDLVFLLVKVAIAAVPAAIIVAIIGMIVGGLLAGVFGAIFGG